jgi:hypothetical protein
MWSSNVFTDRSHNLANSDLAKAAIMITGAHITFFSKNAVADRNFFKDVLKIPNVDAGDGWLIFGLPKLTLGVSAGDSNESKQPDEEDGATTETKVNKAGKDNKAKTTNDEFFLHVHDMTAFMKEMTEPWGIRSKLKLPGGSILQVYQPLHCIPGEAKN